MSFVRTQRFFRKPATLLNPGGFCLDFIALLILAFFYFVSLPDLERFNGTSAAVEVNTGSVSAVFAFGLYGARISLLIAALRRNRMPQTAEWLVTLIGLALIFFGIVFGGDVLDLYAHARGYDFCFARAAGKTSVHIFALHGHPCPAR